MNSKLREKALEVLKEKKSKFHGNCSEKDFTEIVHELDVYAEELKIQNEELLEQIEQNKSLNKYNTALYENAPNPYLVLNQEFKIIKFNKKAIAEFDGLIAKPEIFTLIEQSSKRDFMTWFLNIPQTDSLDVRMNTVNGVRWFRVSADFFNLIFMITCVDIDASVQEKEKFSNMFYNNTSKMFLVRLRDGKILDVNQSVKSSYGYSDDEWAQFYIKDIDPIEESQLDSIITTIVNESKFQFITHHKLKNGEIITVKVNSTKLHMDGEDVSLSIVEDITQQIEQEQELKELNRTLQKRVEEQVKDIQEKEHALLAQQRLAQMGEMLQMIAHQWRQPLNNLSVNVQLLTMKLSSGDIDEAWAKEKEEVILKNVRGLSQTISDFQDYFSPTKEIQEFDLKTLADDTVHVIQHHIDKYNIQVNNQIQKDLSILGYRGEVGQALLVIITNAKDQFEQLQCEERKIDLLSRVEGENVSITVCDTAGGIPDDVMPKIFDPYFTTKGDLNGAGIGLYMVKMMIEQSLKGKVKAYNNDKGACFEIMLPMGGVSDSEK